MSSTPNSHRHDYVSQDSKIRSNERKTLFVVILTFITMVVEVAYGYWTGSMALLADGWHMASHAGALGISVIAYKLARSKKLNDSFCFGTGKFIPLGGYTSALMLGIVAMLMGYESLTRFLNPVPISFSTAILVAVVGLVVNIVSVIILWDDHGHGEDHTHDHNHKSALVHVIADILTSVFAIMALLLGKYFGWFWADPIMGMIGAAVLLKWAFGLCKETVWELLDGNSKLINNDSIVELFKNDPDTKVVDLHIWRIAPNAHACELIVYSETAKGSDYYRAKILDNFGIEHLIIEERHPLI